MENNFIENSDGRVKALLPYVFGAAIFFIAVVLTDANFWADSADYVDSVVARRLGSNYNFWEFGHLFWRPFGSFVWTRFFPATSGDFWRAEIFSIFQSANYFAGFVSTLVLTGILKKLKIRVSIIIITIVAFVFSHAVLNFAQTGASYVPALMFYLLGLFFAVRRANGKLFFDALLSGVCLSFSLCFWLPFLWTLPAVFLASLALYGFSRENLSVLTIQIAAFSVATAVCYGTVLAILRIDTFGELKSWIAAASHGNETRGAMRMVFGLARSFVNMGGDGVLFKRFLLRDAYNPVSLAALVGGGLWKVAAFYALAGSVLFSLWKKIENRKILVLLLAAALPMLVFATLFDGGAVERYLPLFPVAFVGLAAALETEKYKFLRYFMWLILTLSALVNISALSVWTAAQQQRRFVARVGALDAKAAEKDSIFLVSWTDDLMNFNRSYPYNPINSRGNLKFGAIVTPGSTQTLEWREEFAARAFRTWANGKNVWLSRRAFAEKPEADWNWTEGDDKNVGWREFPEFFGKLETGEAVGDADGFVLISPSEANKKTLQDYKEKFSGGGNQF